MGNYLIGFIKQSTGSFDAAMFMMGGVMLLAAAAVAAFPLAWAHSSSGSAGTVGDASGGRNAACSGTRGDTLDKQLPAAPAAAAH